mmetsp:Transcript_20756/g.64527  ORF Transcript_20756/g.64527 Transcript_20756/m.64527 type:complete len:319 (-) Transcript_20756:162-1118(-)
MSKGDAKTREEHVIHLPPDARNEPGQKQRAERAQARRRDRDAEQLERFKHVDVAGLAHDGGQLEVRLLERAQLVRERGSLELGVQARGHAQLPDRHAQLHLRALEHLSVLVERDIDVTRATHRHPYEAAQPRDRERREDIERGDDVVLRLVAHVEGDPLPHEHGAESEVEERDGQEERVERAHLRREAAHTQVRDQLEPRRQVDRVAQVERHAHAGIGREVRSDTRCKTAQQQLAELEHVEEGGEREQHDEQRRHAVRDVHRDHKARGRVLAQVGQAVHRVPHEARDRGRGQGNRDGERAGARLLEARAEPLGREELL